MATIKNFKGKIANNRNSKNEFARPMNINKKEDTKLHPLFYIVITLFIRIDSLSAQRFRRALLLSRLGAWQCAVV